MTNSSSQPVPASLDDVVAILQRNQDTLEQILVWTKIGGSDKLKATLESALDSAQKKLIYQLSDGRSIREITEETKASAATISRYWSAWNKIGFMKTECKGRRKKHKGI